MTTNPGSTLPERSSIDAEAHRLTRVGRWREALPLAERAVAGAGTCLTGHGFLASILLHLGRTQEAERIVLEAAALPAGSAEAYDGLAYMALAIDRHELAHGLYRRAAELAPLTPRHWYNLACSERSFGRLADSEACCDRAIALDPVQYPTYLLRSELRVQRPEASHVDELQTLAARAGLDDRARMYLGYALAKELDDVGRFEEAFHWFATAARARRSQMTYDIAADEATLERLACIYPKDRPAVRQAAGSRCVFIVGLPRSGTTLVERILSGLMGVRSNGETDNFSRALAAAARGAGDMFVRAAAADPGTVAANYARLARVGVAGDQVIDKQPTNYLYLGAIHRALPNATVVWVTRAPLDSCFAMFRTLFGEAYPFTYDFEELARYHAAYDKLMKHWRLSLGSRLHEVRYEDLVREPQVVGAAVARHCNLTWTAAAVDIQQNASVSLTASAAQVRRPIYGTSSGRWRHYRAQLAPLVAALRRHGVAVPDDA